MSPGPYAGIGLALLAATAYNVGVILEKRALGRMPALDVRRVVHVVTSLLTDPAWLAGFALMLTGLACQVIVLTFEPVSVVQPVLASGVALLLVLSRLVLRERLGRAETWCVAAMAAALVMLALSAGEGSAAAGHHASAGLDGRGHDPLGRHRPAGRVPSAACPGGPAPHPGHLLRYRHRAPVRRLGPRDQGAVRDPRPPSGPREPGDRDPLVALPVRAGRLFGGRHAAVPGRAAVLPRVHHGPGVQRFGQRLLHDRGDLAVPRAACRPPRTSSPCGWPRSRWPGSCS